MKIVYEKNQATVPFWTLAVTNVFSVPFLDAEHGSSDRPTLYMKVSFETDGSINALRLDTGTLIDIGEDVDCICYDATLTVKTKKGTAGDKENSMSGYKQTLSSSVLTKRLAKRLPEDKILEPALYRELFQLPGSSVLRHVLEEIVK